MTVPNQASHGKEEELYCEIERWLASASQEEHDGLFEAGPIPTMAISERPTSDPTNIPTMSPSKRPTSDPTHIPTMSPSEKPTSDPTMSMSEKPANDPTNDPTASLSEPEINDPTSEPTESPMSGAIHAYHPNAEPNGSEQTEQASANMKIGTAELSEFWSFWSYGLFPL